MGSYRFFGTSGYDFQTSFAEIIFTTFELLVTVSSLLSDRQKNRGGGGGEGGASVEGSRLKPRD